MFKLGCFLIVVLVIAVPVVAGQYLPWWGTLLVVIGEAALLIVVVPALIRLAITVYARNMIESKSKVLRGAKVEMHECRVVPEPPREEDPDVDDDPALAEEMAAERDRVARYVLVDCTITPDGGHDGPMTHWDPYDFQLCPFDKDTGFSAMADEDSDDAEDEGELETVRLIDEHGRETEDLDKLHGPARLRIVFACPAPLIGRAKLRYYFEGIGDLMLP